MVRMQTVKLFHYQTEGLLCLNIEQNTIVSRGEIKYDDLCTTVYDNAVTKLFWKRGLAPANLLDYRLNLKKTTAQKRK